MFEEIDSMLSLICSGIACISTFYFWLVRSNQERPNLVVTATNRLAGSVVLVQEDSYPYHNLVHIDDHYWGRYSLELIVANRSALSDAILNIQVSVLLANNSWVTSHCRVDPETPMPLNLPPSTTQRVTLAMYLPVEKGAKNRQERIDSANAFLHNDRLLRVCVTGLNKNSFEVEVDASGVGADPLVRAQAA